MQTSKLDAKTSTTNFYTTSNQATTRYNLFLDPSGIALMFLRRTSASGAGLSPFATVTTESGAVSSTSRAPFGARKGAERLASSAMAVTLYLLKGSGDLRSMSRYPCYPTLSQKKKKKAGLGFPELPWTLDLEAKPTFTLLSALHEMT